MASVNPAERVIGYEEFFGLKEPPFSLAPDPRFLFASASHSAALSQIAYAIDRREPIVVVTGEIGTGKTLLCRTVLQRLPRKTFVSVVDDPLLGADDLLTQLLRDFGVISQDAHEVAAAGRHERVEAVYAFLRSLAAIHAHAVVIIDEAQHLQPSVLEQIRLLSNISDQRGTLLQIILVGQRDMEPLLSRPELRQLEQRVTRRFRLERLTADEVEQYVAHRLARAREGLPSSETPGVRELARAVAEWEGDQPSVEFQPPAIAEVARLSGGLPRLVNVICDRALESAFAARVRVIDASVVHAVARPLGIGGVIQAETPQAAEAAAAHPSPPVTDAPFWTVRTPEPPRSSASAADLLVSANAGGSAERVPDFFSAGAPTPETPRSRRLYIAGAAVVIAIAAIWFGMRAVSGGTTPTRTSPTTPVPAETAPSRPPAPAAPPVADPKPGGTAAPSPAVKQPGATSSATSDAAAASGKFEIVVASFRTELRALSVQTAIEALGIPVRTRVASGWQQVICGPFASRAAAEDAKQRLERAGITGTQIVPSAR